MLRRIYKFLNASVAQLVEQLIRNEQVIGSTPITGSIKIIATETFVSFDAKVISEKGIK